MGNLCHDPINEDDDVYHNHYNQDDNVYHQLKNHDDNGYHHYYSEIMMVGYLAGTPTQSTV